MSEKHGLEFVTDFLLSKNPELTEIDPEMDLIESRIITSLMFIEFLYRLEEATGREIKLESIAPNDFRTVSTINDRFFSVR